VDPNRRDAPEELQRPAPTETEEPLRLTIVDYDEWAAAGDPLEAFQVETLEEPPDYAETAAPKPADWIDLALAQAEATSRRGERFVRELPSLRLQLQRQYGRPVRVVFRQLQVATLSALLLPLARSGGAWPDVSRLRFAAGVAGLAVVAVTAIAALNVVGDGVGRWFDRPAATSAVVENRTAPVAATPVPEPETVSAPAVSEPSAAVDQTEALVGTQVDTANPIVALEPSASSRPTPPPPAPPRQTAREAAAPPTLTAPPRPSPSPASATEATATTPAPAVAQSPRQVQTAPPPLQLPQAADADATRRADSAPPAVPRPIGTTAVAEPTPNPPSPAPPPPAAPVSLPGNSVAPPTAASIAPPAAVTRVAATPTSAIESVLNRYAFAFSMLDAARAKAVWPTVNERSLERAFDSLETQKFDLGECAISVTMPRAVASCEGTAHYAPKVGNKKLRTERRRWTFRLQQSGEDWAIESVDSR
jgi:hypothetical protein